MPQLIFADYPPQIFWLVVTFAILYILMAYVALPRVESVLEERRKRIADDLEAAERSKKDSEAVIAAMADNRAELVGESADLLFHLLVLLADCGIPFDDVLNELDRREGLSGLVEKAARPKD